MDAPICRFVREYAAGGISRLHMPGHKGVGPIGCEAVDITEIAGADDLSCPDGIIAGSEHNATALFGSRATFYSTGGSSQCVKAMLLLCARRSKSRTVLAARNVHKSFMYACALLDLIPEWLCGEETSSLCSCPVGAEELERALSGMDEMPCAIYITTPDYLGGMQDVRALAGVAHAHGVPLVVDNAHGAYLKFLPGGSHPIELGADMCCDSAHKTLGVLTGGAYLHVSRQSAWDFESDAREALGVFGSSSPSYLVMQSLDAMNVRLSSTYRSELAACVEKLCALKNLLAEAGLPVAESDPLRLTVAAHSFGRHGYGMADALRAHKVEPEFADRDYLVMMFTPDTDEAAYRRVEAALTGIAPGVPFPALKAPRASERVLTPREAMLAPRESVPASLAAGRVSASAAVSCPPAIPVAVMGELITHEHTVLLRSLGIDSVDVVK